LIVRREATHPIAQMSPRFPAAVPALITAAACLFVTRASAEETQKIDEERMKEMSDPNGFSEDRDHVRVGPIVGLGLPRPLAIEALVKIERVVGLGLEYSFLPRMNLFGVDTTFYAVAADLRVFPFRGGFFLGLRAGYQRIGAQATVSIAQLGSLTESAVGESAFLNPRLGFLWTWNNGFTIGIDAGVQLPVSSSITSTLPSGVLVEVDDAMVRVANTLGHAPTPTVDLLRIGFLF